MIELWTRNLEKKLKLKIDFLNTNTYLIGNKNNWIKEKEKKNLHICVCCFVHPLGTILLFLSIHVHELPCHKQTQSIEIGWFGSS